MGGLLEVFDKRRMDVDVTLSLKRQAHEHNQAIAAERLKRIKQNQQFKGGAASLNRITNAMADERDQSQTGTPLSGGRRCFLCKSKFHMRNECPDKEEYEALKGNKVTPSLGDSILLTTINVEGEDKQLGLLDSGSSRNITLKSLTKNCPIYSDAVITADNYIYKRLTLNGLTRLAKLYIVDKLPNQLQIVISKQTMVDFEFKMIDHRGHDLFRHTQTYFPLQQQQNKQPEPTPDNDTILLSFSIHQSPDPELKLEQVPGWEKSEVSDNLLKDVKGLTVEEVTELRALLREVAWDPESGKHIKGYNHKIRVKEGAVPKFQYYPEKNFSKRQAMDKETNQMERFGFVEDAPWASTL
eukprot:Pgem_evm2s1022